VEYLVRETFNWFSVSPKRRDAYKTIYETIELRGAALTNNQVTKSSENCYMAEVLHSMYSDPQNILYLTFLKSVLEPIDGYISPSPYLGYLFESKEAELLLAPEEKNQ
ncbi:hypothetical protein KUCAC02_023539, partial [Chaenocephalus aceratus]